VTGSRKRILAVVGTRPEGIKMAPVIHALAQEAWADVRVITTAQHRNLLDEVLETFGIVPDLDLDLMQSNQTLAALTARLAVRFDEVLASEAPDMVIAQGDTTTVMMAALCSFYREVPFGHVEAGLRTHDRKFPFPEEMNRVFAGYLSSLHFAPTESARQNLLKEGVPEACVHVTGNTVIDALLYQVGRMGAERPDGIEPVDERVILVTAHRRENFGAPLEDICSAVLDLVGRFPEVKVVFPVHPNPNVRAVTDRLLRGHERISLCEPLGYRDFVAAMRRADLILTDSGGVQEEAPALAKPVLVLRRETERPEAVEVGVVELVGTDRERIVSAASRLLQDKNAYARMAQGVSPYGDGRASERIVSLVRAYLRA
jgi:UDP-N-acetylglucosamine 2-epimerase (non-hydrolysing)